MHRNRSASIAIFLAVLPGIANAQDRLWSAAGSLPRDELGWSVNVVGDVNGDGVPDVAASHSRHGSLSRFFDGGTGATLFDLRKTELFFARLTDVDADGADDVLIDPAATPNHSWVMSGRTTATLCARDRPADRRRRCRRRWS